MIFQLLTLIAFLSFIRSETIFEINGSKFLSPFVNQTVTGVTGVVTVLKQSSWDVNGFWIESTTSTDSRNAIFVRFKENDELIGTINPGDIVQFGASVEEVFHFPPWLNNHDVIATTELASPFNLTVVSSNNPLPEPIIIGAKGLHPPTQQYTLLDNGSILASQGDPKSLVGENPTLSPAEYGLDFWESLMGKLVTITNPVMVSQSWSIGDEFWVRGDWPATGINQNGGLTVNTGSDGSLDYNPEAIRIESPLDSSWTDLAPMGSTLKDITGVIYYNYGTYVLFPLTAPVIAFSNNQFPSPSALVINNDNKKCSLTFGDYNIASLSIDKLNSLSDTAFQFAQFLGTPDLVFLQEVSDDTLPTDLLKTVSSNKTLDTFIKVVEKVTGIVYEHTYVAPLFEDDSIQSWLWNHNERPVLLYRKDRLRLVDPHPGGPRDAALPSISNEKVGLSFNPGRIDPVNEAWRWSSKPLVAHFEVIETNERLFAINVQGGQKEDLEIVRPEFNARPPTNLNAEKNAKQTKVIANFVKSILDLDANASVILSGNFNEITQNSAVFSPLITDLPMVSTDEVAKVPPEERYTTTIGQNSLQYDHAFISPRLQTGGAEVEHIHINNWVQRTGHGRDPSVSRVKFC